MFSPSCSAFQPGLQTGAEWPFWTRLCHACHPRQSNHLRPVSLEPLGKVSETPDEWGILNLFGLRRQKPTLNSKCMDLSIAGILKLGNIQPDSPPGTWYRDVRNQGFSLHLAGSRVDLESPHHPLALYFLWFLCSSLISHCMWLWCTIDCEWEQLQGRGMRWVITFLQWETQYPQASSLGPEIWIGDRFCASSKLVVFCVYFEGTWELPPPEILQLEPLFC